MVPETEAPIANKQEVNSENLSEEAIPLCAETPESADNTEKTLPASKPPKRRKKLFYRFVKRTFDIFTSFLFLIIFSWLYIILLVAVKCSSRGRAIFKHKRVGKNNKDIYLPKFRSMKENAERLEDMLTPEQLAEYKTEYKLDYDPRVTKLGSKLRKLILDELPQIWSIFTGKISVVGPRPLIREELEDKYGEEAGKLVSVKPGLIGWWAVNGRNNSTYSSGERQKLELYYVDHCSLGLDVKIFFKAIGCVFKRTGAK